MGGRQNISSGAAWEEIVGYSRAVRIGALVEAAGTTAVDENGQVVGSDAYTQARYALAKIEKALHEAGASLQDVIRTRMFVVDMADWQEVGRAHGEYFKDIKPAASLVAVKTLIDPQLLVEIEATAVISAG